MNRADLNDAALDFNAMRPKLMRVAYRMLGSVGDAEDIVQDAFIRWMAVDRPAVREPEAYLRCTVTRLCLDQLKSARHQREIYVGTWLPEPLVEDVDHDDITLPLMLVLERLSPLERAAFLLHDVFGVPFEEIATTLDRDATACRQLATRARNHVREARPRFKIEKKRALQIAEAFFRASREGDLNTLGTLLTADVSLHADGGGKRPAVAEPIMGYRAVMEAMERLAALVLKNRSTLIRTVYINGLPGFITLEADGQYQTTALDTDGEKIAGIYVVRNPDKLKHL